jgi:exodeoxyribonuclease V alpha subunit
VKRLQRLAAAGHLAPIDAELGALLGRKASAALGDVNEVGLVALTGALLSAERARGNSCVDLRQAAGGAPWPQAEGIVFPDAGSWRSLLERSRLCNDGGSPAPLVLDGERLYLRRFHAAERRLAEAVKSRVGAVREPIADAGCIALFRKLFPSTGAIDWQAVAAAAALRGRLTVITGGPGTGKTTTVARILALLLQREPELRVALAAPTGKAAARLSESIASSLASLPIDDAARARFPRDGRTLHRLLGYQPWDDRFAHGPDRPLGEDIVVVDEASMVDLLTMDALFSALRPSARVILLGDPDQLASVDTGHVLGDLCAAAGSCGEEHGSPLGAWFAALSDGMLARRDSPPRLRRAAAALVPVRAAAGHRRARDRGARR